MSNSSDISKAASPSVVSKKMVYSNALLTVCISAVLVSVFLMTNTDYCHLLVWRVISSHTGTERMLKFAIGHNLCGVFKCKCFVPGAGEARQQHSQLSSGLIL